MRKCVICDGPVYRTGSRGPYPKYCGQKCVTKSKRTPQRIEYERLYRRAERAGGKRDAYERSYYQRPEVKERYRQRWRELYGDKFRGVEVASPYTGHMWLEKIRGMVPAFDQSAPWADKYNDMIGEGVLAFLEGRDPAEAMETMRKDYSRQENQHVYFSELAQRTDDPSNWERFLPVNTENPEQLETPEMYHTIDINAVNAQSIVQPRVKWKKNKARRLHAGNRKGSRGPNRSHRKFRSKDYD